MDFIDDVVLQGEPVPACILPSNCPRIPDLGRSVNACRLKRRGRVGPVLDLIEAINVLRSRSNPFGDPFVITAVRSLQPH
jgi:hypothetical protein